MNKILLIILATILVSSFGMKIRTKTEWNDCESTCCFYYLNTNASSWISGGIGKVSQCESSAPCWKSSSKSLDDMKSNCSAGCAKNSNFTYI